jgi:hypothetical protein
VREREITIISGMMINMTSYIYGNVIMRSSYQYNNDTTTTNNNITNNMYNIRRTVLKNNK